MKDATGKRFAVKEQAWDSSFWVMVKNINIFLNTDKTLNISFVGGHGDRRVQLIAVVGQEPRSLLPGGQGAFDAQILWWGDAVGYIVLQNDDHGRCAVGTGPACRGRSIDA